MTKLSYVEIDPRRTRLRHSKRELVAWAKVLDRLTVPYRLVMLTLTYREGAEWGSNDIRAFMRSVKSVLGDDLLTYAWIAELQVRGAVHYHVMLAVKPGTDVPAPDKSGMWIHGLSRRESWHSLRYLIEYAGKLEQKGLGEWYYPKGCRVVGLSWAQASSWGARLIRKLASLPEWVGGLCGCSAEVIGAQRVVGGWLVGSVRYRSQWSYGGHSRYRYVKVYAS